jgi:hypothetical protein
VAPRGGALDYHAGVIVLLALLGCARTKLLRLENQVLEQENTKLQQSLAGCEAQAPPPDFAVTVTPEIVADYLRRAGYADAKIQPTGVLTAPVAGTNTDFTLTIQLFEREKVLFVAATEYLQLEEATSSKAMVLLLTQLAASNYELLLGKFQLNPKNGEITLSVELNLDDGLGFRTFHSVVHHLTKTADERYPSLLRAAQGQGI